MYGHWPFYLYQGLAEVDHQNPGGADVIHIHLINNDSETHYLGPHGGINESISYLHNDSLKVLFT